MQKYCVCIHSAHTHTQTKIVCDITMASWNLPCLTTERGNQDKTSDHNFTLDFHFGECIVPMESTLCTLHRWVTIFLGWTCPLMVSPAVSSRRWARQWTDTTHGKSCWSLAAKPRLTPCMVAAPSAPNPMMESHQSRSPTKEVPPWSYLGKNWK